MLICIIFYPCLHCRQPATWFLYLEVFFSQNSSHEWDHRIPFVSRYFSHSISFFFFVFEWLFAWGKTNTFEYMLKDCFQYHTIWGNAGMWVIGGWEVDPRWRLCILGMTSLEVISCPCPAFLLPVCHVICSNSIKPHTSNMMHYKVKSPEKKWNHQSKETFLPLSCFVISCISHSNKNNPRCFRY